MAKIIFIEAGHGGNDPGAIAYDGTTEAELNIELRDLIVRRLIEQNYEACGIQGSMMELPDGKVFSDNDLHRLWQTVNQVNQIAGPDDFLMSIHFNFNHPTATGTEVFCSPQTSDYNEETGEILSKKVAGVLGIANRGLKYSNQTRFGKLAILDDVKPRALLLEVCFLNEHDLAAYRGKEQMVANAVVSVLANRLNF